MSDDMLAVMPEPIMVTLRGETFEIKQIRVGQLSKAMRITHPFYEQLKSAKDKAKSAKSEEENTYGFDIYSLVMENSDTVLELVALLVNKPRDWVDDLGVDELVQLFGAIVEVNLDFFTQRVLPLLSGLVAGVSGKLFKTPQAGPTLSKP